jgi:tetratricopeptide (TPR) repeat protein
MAAGCSASTTTSPRQAPATGAADADERLLEQGVQLVIQHRPAEAIRDCFDKVIAHYEVQYPHGAKGVYCSRSMEETIGYLVMAQASGQNAIAIAPTWADAYYFKGSALIELGRVPEARASLEKAVGLSPKNSSYLSELAFTYQAEKNWDQALKVFADAAKTATAYSAPAGRTVELTRALRGQGYSLTELGRLDEAEAKYRESLAADSGDHEAEQEIEYIEQLRRKADGR